MTRQVGGFTVEGRYFIVLVPEGWQEMDPLPPPGPSDRWFDRVSHFRAALDGVWIRWPVWRSPWVSDAPTLAPPAPEAPSTDAPHAQRGAAAKAYSRSLDDLTESDGGARDVAARFVQPHRYANRHAITTE